MSPAITERKSLLTQGLEPLAKHSHKIRDLLDRLYALDDDLQDAHVRAKRDDEYGEDVVRAYRKFLALRQILIDELERLQVPVPWQMRMRIDDIELTVPPPARAAEREDDDDHDDDDHERDGKCRNAEQQQHNWEHRKRNRRRAAAGVVTGAPHRDAVGAVAGRARARVALVPVVLLR